MERAPHGEEAQRISRGFTETVAKFTTFFGTTGTHASHNARNDVVVGVDVESDEIAGVDLVGVGRELIAPLANARAGTHDDRVTRSWP